ncbi:MAG TPA: carbohydrate-binding domain-containing protein [Bacteroidales bacterium]|nr:carbohydrate-binding domain-containing protein [Bacteroidales bacterium]HPT20299.1 carbohydrate-binding domain-containing protein [Bacteroidales bacterium]
MKKQLLSKLLFITGILFTGLIILSVVFALTGFLNMNKKTNANILIAEGWLPSDGIQAACNEFKTIDYQYLLTTGLETDFDGGFMYSRGYLIFYPREILADNNASGKHIIEVSAFSELDGENAACFDLYINDTIFKAITTSKRIRKYEIAWKGRLSDIDSITISFTNDSFGDFGDRNLYIKSITIDKKIIIPILNYSEYDLNDLDGKDRIKNDFTSYAAKAKEDFERHGIDPHCIISLPAKKTSLNRTLASAIEVKKWLDTSSIKVTGVNIISYGMHARRTWIIYSKILGNKANVGIVSLPDNINLSRTDKIFRALRETLGILYYRLILLFY